MRTVQFLIRIVVVLMCSEQLPSCYSITLPELLQEVDTIGPREARNHALRARLCPAGMSQETCFYSQLSMYIKIQDSLVDPVDLRNIGKRTDKDVAGIGDRTSDSYPRNGLKPLHRGQEPNLAGYVDRYGPIDSRLFLDKTKHQSAAEDISDLFTHPDVLGNLELENMVTMHKSNGALKEKRTPEEVVDAKFSPRIKKQIMCPSGMARVDCYDNAFAFYLRLLRTVGDQ